MNCPDCNGGLHVHEYDDRQPHGEVLRDIRWECGNCGAVYTDAELQAAWLEDGLGYDAGDHEYDVEVEG